MANLVKRPMRRWWARVGSLWMVGLGLLLVAQAVQVAVQNQAFGPVSFMAPGDITTQDWYKLIGIFTNATYMVSIGVALLCAINVITVIDRATHETLAFNKAELRVLKFKLALLYCWPALVPIVIWVSILHYWTLGSQLGISYSVWMLVVDSLNGAFPFFAMVIWLVPVAVVTTGTRWQVWSLVVCSQLPLILILLSISGYISLNSDLPDSYQRIEFSDMESTVITGIGLGLVYLLFYLFLDRKNKLASLLCLGYCIVLLCPSTVGLTGIYLVDYILMAGIQMEGVMQPLAFTYSHFDSTLRLFLGDFRTEFPAGPAWAIIPVLNGIFWLFAHYFAFSWLMGRDWGRKGSRCQVKG